MWSVAVCLVSCVVCVSLFLSGFGESLFFLAPSFYALTDSRGRLRLIVGDGVEGNEGNFRLDGSFSPQSASMDLSVLVSLSEVVESESVEESRDPRMMGNECQL